MATDALTELINQINQGNAQGTPNFDPALNTAIQQILLRAADLDSQLARGKTRLDSDYQMQEYLLKRDMGQALDTLAQTTADRGLMRSGIYVEDQARTSQGYQDQLADAARRRAQALADLEQGYKSGRTELQAGLLGERQSSADRMAAARHQAQLEAQQAAYRENQMAMQRDYYAQQQELQRQGLTQQQDYYNRALSSMQPQTNPQGQSSYPDFSNTQMPSNFSFVGF